MYEICSKLTIKTAGLCHYVSDVNFDHVIVGWVSSYKFSRKLTFISFYPHSLKPNTRIKVLGSWWSGNEKYLCLLFIAILALLQGHSEFNRLLERNFF